MKFLTQIKGSKVALTSWIRPLEQGKQVANQLINAIKHLASDENTVIVNIADKKGNTPLLLAAKNGKLAYMQDLLACGAAWSAVSKDGMSILHHSAGGNAQQVVKVQDLVTHALKSPQKAVQQNARELIGLQNNEGQTAVHIALETDDIKFAEFLIKHKINLNAKDKKGKNSAAHSGRKE